MSREMPEPGADYYSSALGLVPLRWTAPEVLKTRHHSVQSDVWSYGILCCEVLNNGAKVGAVDVVGIILFFSDNVAYVCAAV